MTPHETALVTILLERLKKTDSPDKDPEAETLIRHTTAEQPDAAYYLVQTVLIQDLSLHAAQNRIAELEKNLVETKTVPFLPHSFLGGLSTSNEPAPRAAAPPRLRARQRLTSYAATEKLRRYRDRFRISALSLLKQRIVDESS
jgi:hypothetical protein